MEKIKNAIIIHGPGRSGTTLLSNILSLHRDFYWISGYMNKYPYLPILSLGNNLQQIKYFEKFSRHKRKFPRPSEAYGFWKYFFKDFNRQERVPDENAVKAVIKTIRKIEKYSLGHRFITKLTGEPRLDYLDRIFEEPIILWIDRKPESVVMSYYKQKWNYKSRPELFEAKSKLELIEEYCDKYKKTQIVKAKLKKFQFIQLFYEDLISNPLEFFSELSQEIELPMNYKFRELINDWEIYRDSNESYKNYLGLDELLYLRGKLIDETTLLGYK